MTDARIKVDFFRRKSATKFLYVKTFSGKVVLRHLLAYLSVHKWLVGDIPRFLCSSWATSWLCLQHRPQSVFQVCNRVYMLIVGWVIITDDAWVICWIADAEANFRIILVALLLQQAEVLGWLWVCSLPARSHAHCWTGRCSFYHELSSLWFDKSVVSQTSQFTLS